MTSKQSNKKSTIDKIKKFFSKESVKDAIFDATLIGSGLLAFQGIKAIFGEKEQNAQQAIHKEVKLKAPDLNKKYKIPEYKANSPEFDEIYQKALPLIQMALMPTEVLVLHPYADKGGELNTLGLGNYFLPKDGNPQSGTWVYASEYISKNPEITVTGDKALALNNGYYSVMDKAARKNKFHKDLAGAELNLKQIAAAFSVTTNNPTHGAELCAFMRDSSNTDFACMQKIVSFIPQSCKDGIACRHVHEALLLLNRNNYISKMKDFYIAKYDKGYVTSVTQLSPKSTDRFKKAVSEKDLATIDEIQEKIVNYKDKNGKTVQQILQEEIYNDTLRAKLLCFGDGSTKYLGIEPFAISATLIEAYKKGDFPTVVQSYEQLHDHGYGNTDSLYNIAAIAYYETGNYKRCVKVCKALVNDKTNPYYEKSLYLAGKAHEKDGNYARALANYKCASRVNKDNAEYSEAIARVEKLVPKNTQLAKNNLSKKSKESMKRIIDKKTQKAQRNVKNTKKSKSKTPQRTVKKPVNKKGRTR